MPAAPTQTPATTDALRAEVLGADTMAVAFEGLDFTVPRDVQDWPVDAMEAMEDGKAATALRALLPAAQWTAFKAQSPKPTIRTIAALLDAIAVEAGFKSAGE
jgi:hypothetical protein